MSFVMILFIYINIVCFQKYHLFAKSNTPKYHIYRKLNNLLEPIRIIVDETCLYEDLKTNISPEDFNLLNYSIYRAKESLQKLINVTERLENNIIFQKQILDNNFQDCINQNYLSNGAQADLLIFIRSKKPGETLSDYPNIVKYINDDNQKRPIIGTIVYDFKSLDEDNEYNKQKFSLFFLHEFTHILGFKKQILINKNILEDIQVVNRLKTNDKKNVKAITGPTVLNWGKKYFNCSSLQGIEIDDTSSEGDEYIHWSPRLLLGDYMIAQTYYPEQYISEFTLALLEDLGWYKVNYFTGGLMKFGKNKGCGFLEKDCVYSVRQSTGVFSDVFSSFQNEFCNYKRNYEYATTLGTCSSGRQSMGYCYGPVDSNSLDNSLKREFTSHYGFGKSFFESCPITYEFNNDPDNSKIGYYYGNCKIGNGKYGNYLGVVTDINKTYRYYNLSNVLKEEYSDNSFCALSSILKKEENITKGIIRPSCYKMFCSDESLTIKIGEEYIVCPHNGGLIKVEGQFTKYEGYLYCPDYYLICSGSENKLCNNIFDCIDKNITYKESAYNNEYSNENISISLTTNIAEEIKEKTIIGYELSNNGNCPQYCRQCISYHQCIICNDPYNLYVGTKKNDTNPILCYKDDPGDGYYKTETYITGKQYYFTCIENCMKCTEENEDECKQCYPTHFINEDNICEERIPGCKDYDNSSSFEDPNNNNAEGYKACYNCDNTAGFYCVDNITTVCINLTDYTNETYYNMQNKDYPCVQKCDKKYTDCEKCNSITCTKCKYNNTFINKNHNCVRNVTHCQAHNEFKDASECLTCQEGYHCLRNDTSKCQVIDNINDFYYYYNYTENNIRCYERCNNTFQNCVKCTEKGCLICESGYFVYNGKCIKNITGCIDHFYDGTLKECNKCNEEEGFYCLNNSKVECYDISLDSYLPYYYKSTNNDFSCYITCDNLLDNCLTCDGSKCTNCTSRYIINDAGNFCLVRPFIVPDDDKCTFNKTTPIDETIFEIDPSDFNVKYWENNIPYISIVDQYIGNNFTVTVFINSECTEALLPAGYFKINVSELQQTMIKESHTEGMKLLFSVYINYNHKGHLIFYNISSRYLDPYKLCNSCLDVDYYLTNNKLNVTLNDSFGMAILNLIYSENLDIVNKDFDIYNDICKNVTLFGIDIPLKRRLHYLSLHNYTDEMLCYSDNCTLDEYDYENSTVVCKCRMGNKLEDVIYSEKFEYKPYDDKEELKKSNEFIESLSTIKCAINGFKSKNFKPNIGLFICIAFIAIQIGLFIFYSLKSKPIVNANRPINMSNPPKKSVLKFLTDWNKSIHNGKIGNEEEIFVQPRDEAEDQLLEEERSFVGENIIDISGLSIDTNVGGVIKGVSTGNKIREKADQKRVLILLSNKGKKKSKTYVEDMKSDSDIIPQPEDQDENNSFSTINYGKIYWQVLSLKQHIINFFSFILCFKITESFIPLPIRLIRSLFMIILSFILNILFLNQSYYDSKFSYFNKEYTIINSETGEIFIPKGKKITYAIKNTFVKALISLVILLVVQFLFGIIFFSVRKSLIKARAKKSHKAIQEISAKSKVKNIVFFVFVMACMILFFFTLSGFIAIYGGGVVDYLTAGIISLILLEIIPFLWSLIIALFRYFGIKNNNKCLFKFSQFFMF